MQGQTLEIRCEHCNNTMEAYFINEQIIPIHCIDCKQLIEKEGTEFMILSYIGDEDITNNWERAEFESNLMYLD